MAAMAAKAGLQRKELFYTYLAIQALKNVDAARAI